MKQQDEQLSAGLDKAAQHEAEARQQMSKATDRLQQKKMKPAGQAQRKAAAALQQMSDKLQKQIEQLAEQMQLAENAQQQQNLHKRAEQLAVQMRNPDQEQLNAEPAPGAEETKQAGESMQNANDALNEQYPREAELDQQEAMRKLQKAQQKLQQAIDQKRRQQMQALLGELKEKLEIMLAEQEGINEASRQLADKTQDDWTREDTLQLAELSQQEKEQLVRADEVLQLLEKDDTTVIFPQLMQQAREDMATVAERLAAKKLDPLTLQIEADIAFVLEQMLSALRRKSQPSDQQQDNAQDQQQQGQQQKPMLIPPAEELKLLRAGQQRINLQTHNLEARFGQQDNASIREQQARQRLSKRQAELARSAEILLRTLTQQGKQ
jgi:hypothetical protein